MDLAKLDVVKASNEGFDLQLTHPATGEDLPIFVRILGSDSDEFKRIDAEQNRVRLDKVWKGGKFKPSAQTAAEADEVLIAKCALLTKDWWEVEADGTKRRTLESAGEMISLSLESAMKMYRANPWIKEQVYVGINDRANFIKG